MQTRLLTGLLIFFHRHMKHSSVLILLLVISGFIFGIVSNTGCANKIPPTGGPRDSLPPVLVAVRPPDSSKSFNSKKIVFEFNEFVQLDNVQQNLLVSPIPKINPVVESKLRTVTVTIKDTLEPNTTYAIDFGKAIKDINEGNVLRDFTYLFTTGDALDSLTLNGNVIVAETGKPDSTLIVMLHTNLEDSAVSKQKPRYVTRLDSAGRFTFRYLPAGTYAIYALKDEGGQYRYFDKKNLFAFADSTVNPASNPAPVTLYAYSTKEEEDTPPPGQSTGRQGRNRNNNATDENRLRFSTNLLGNELDLLSNFKISFSQAPLQSFDSTGIRLTKDSFDTVTGYYFQLDTSNKVITVVNNWQESTNYQLILSKTFATDTSGRQLLKDDTLNFRTKNERDYGLVRLRLLNLDMSKNPVLQFVQGNEVKQAYPLTSNVFTQRLFLPGDYDLRILYDENRNGIWDPGVFFGEHRQPEKVIPLSRKLTVKANWENEVDIRL